MIVSAVSRVKPSLYYLVEVLPYDLQRIKAFIQGEMEDLGIESLKSINKFVNNDREVSHSSCTHRF